MRNYIKGNKGITLIALVITIIVLLILAGVTIATLTGDNGLLTKAGEAKEQAIIGEEKEKTSLGYINYQTGSEFIVDGATVTGEGPWTITFENTGHQYTLPADGRTIEGPNTLNTSTSTVETFTFTISDFNNSNPITYTAEVGMTWQQWVNSSYNTDGVIIEDEYVLNSSENGAIYRKLQGNSDHSVARPAEFIQADFEECFWGPDWTIPSGGDIPDPVIPERTH